MPKLDKIMFLAMVQAENRIQIPIEVRQTLKLEPGQILRTKIHSANNWFNSGEFFAKLSVDGRITVPWEVRLKTQIKLGEMVNVFLQL